MGTTADAGVIELMDKLDFLIKLVLCVAIYGGLVYTVLNMFYSLLATQWPKARGKVAYAGVDEDYDGSEGGSYKPVIEFKYTVRGKEYISNRFAFGFLSSGFKLLAIDIYRKYSNRPNVMVSYNPKKPQNSVLLTGIRLFHVVQLVFFSVMICVFGPWFGL